MVLNDIAQVEINQGCEGTAQSGRTHPSMLNVAAELM
jgi:hypothetical protein